MNRRRPKLRMPEGRAVFGNRIVQEFSQPAIDEAQTVSLIYAATPEVPALPFTVGIDPASPDGDQSAIVVMRGATVSGATFRHAYASEPQEFLTIAQWAERFGLSKTRIYTQLHRMERAPSDLWYVWGQTSYGGRWKENGKTRSDDGVAELGADDLGRQKSVTYYRADFILEVNDLITLRQDAQTRARDALADAERTYADRQAARSIVPIVPIPSGRRIRV